MKPFLYSRGTIHLHRLDPAIVGIFKYSRKLTEVPFKKVIYATKGRQSWWAWDTDELTNLWRSISRKAATKSGAARQFAYLLKAAKQAIKASESSIHSDLRDLSDQELAQRFLLLQDDIRPAHALHDPDIDAVDGFFETFILEKISDELSKGDKPHLQTIYRQLSRPAFVSYLKKQELDILRAARLNFSERKAELLYAKYWWTALGWENLRPHTKQYFVNHLKKAGRQRNLAKTIKQISNHPQEIKQHRRILLSRYRLSKRIAHWLDVLDRYTQMHDIRKEMQVKSIYASYLYLKEFARRGGWTVDDLEWLWATEIAQAMRGKKIDRSLPRKRRTSIYVDATGKSIKTANGKKALPLIKKFLGSGPGSINQLKGTGVTEGIIRGKVKVCSGYAEAVKKVRAGDILVTGMTLPDYLPAMRKAAAIVTDEGGITCHAAVVSRELGKVCVVGTKTATITLKDGDRVEVNGPLGLVKKI